MNKKAYFKQSTVKAKEIFNAVISHINTPSNFYIQRVSNCLNKILQVYYIINTLLLRHSCQRISINHVWHNTEVGGKYTDFNLRPKIANSLSSEAFRGVPQFQDNAIFKMCSISGFSLPCKRTLWNCMFYRNKLLPIVVLWPKMLF